MIALGNQFIAAGLIAGVVALLGMAVAGVILLGRAVRGKSHG